MPFMFDEYYIILVLPTLVLSLIAQFMVKSTFSKYSKVKNSKGISGQQAASIVMQSENVTGVSIEATGGSLTDHFDPRTKVIRLSQPVHSAASIAAVGVAAHEAGHAIQHATSWGPLGLRSLLVPAANFGSSLGPWLVIIGLVLSGSGDFPFASLLVNIGIIAFSAAVLFYVITLPVEFNASNRAIKILRQNNVLSEQELKGVKKVLTAAALTYVASALTAIMSLLRLILLSRRRR